MQPPVHPVTTWNGVYTVTPTHFVEPASIAEVQAVVRRVASEGGCLRVVGAGHSPTPIAHSHDTILRLRRMRGVTVVDAGAGLVDVEGGATLADVADAGAAVGLAWPCLPSIEELTVAGAIATGTHSTGAHLGGLHTTVRRMTLVTGEGSVVTLTRESHPDEFPAALVSLGLLGVVVGLRLQLVPAFDLQVRTIPCSTAAALDRIESRLAPGAPPFYRLWLFPHTGRALEWTATPVKPVAPPPLSLWGWVRSAATRWTDWAVGYHAFQAALWAGLWLPSLVPAVNQLVVWLFHSAPTASTTPSRPGFTFDCLFKQYVCEYAVPVASVRRVLSDLQAVQDGLGSPVHLPVEVRFVKGDDAWLSPSGPPGGVVAYIGVIMYRPWGGEPPGMERYFAAFESICKAVGGRAHWAKSAVDPAHVRAAYPRLGAFLKLRREWDPRGVLVGERVRQLLGM